MKLLNKDFYHTAAGKAYLDVGLMPGMGMLTVYAAILEVKSKAPNGVSFNVKGKSSHDPATTGQVSKSPLETSLPSRRVVR